MPAYNQVILIGNLTADPQQSGQMTRLGIAVNQKWTDQQGQQQDKTLFINCICFGKLAQTAVQYLHKGSRVFLSGELDLNRWTDQQGQKRETFQVKVQRLQFLDPPPRQRPQQQPPQQGWGQPQNDDWPV